MFHRCLCRSKRCGSLMRVGVPSIRVLELGGLVPELFLGVPLPEVVLGVSVTLAGAGVWAAGGLVAVVVTGVEAVLVLFLVVLGRSLMVPRRLPRPI